MSEETTNVNDWSLEKDGLIVTFDDKESEIRFEWNSETHPQWDILMELSNESFKETFLKNFYNAITGELPSVAFLDLLKNAPVKTVSDGEVTEVEFQS